jgi:hypothetical protein
MTKDLSIRLAVGDAVGRHSTTWSIFSTKNEVYAAHRTMGGIEKISFHSSRICRRAYVSSHQLPPSLEDRVFHRWMRAETGPAGHGLGVAVLTILFPEPHLSPDLPVTQKKTIWLPSPVSGEIRCLQILFTLEAEEYVRQELLSAGQLLVAYHSLPNGEAVAIRSWTNKFEDRDLIMEASHGVAQDLVLPAKFEAGIARPIGFTIYFQPEEMRCFELSGYWVPAGQARLRFPGADTFSRTRLIERSGTQQP